MAVFQRGVPIFIVQEFSSIDPLTEVATSTTPATATFTVQNPEGVEVVYELGVDSEITNPQVGVLVLTLAPPDPPGTWLYRCDADGAGGPWADEGSFDVLESGVLAPVQDQPNLGPCVTWINGEDVARCSPGGGHVGSDTHLLDVFAIEASMALYEIAGRQFTGLCQRKVRPCAEACGCWGTWPIGQWGWGSGPGGIGSGWRNECGDRCGCSQLSEIKLAGYPIREILEVKIGGDVLAAADPDGGWKTYRLDRRRYLVRLNDPGPPVRRLSWPGCQNLALNDDQPGTFSITYSCGVDPPQLGRDAAAAIAWQLYLACPGVSAPGECAIPAGVTRLERQGVTIERELLATWLDPTKGDTGLPAVDLFLHAYWGSKQRGRRPAVWSPDTRGFARREGI